MRVNEGNLNWFSLDYSTVSMQDLVRETLWLTNTSEHIINKKVNEIMLTSGRNRLQESVYASDDLWDFSPYEDWESVIEQRDELMNIDSDKSMRLYMKALSYLTVTNWKKTLVMAYLKSGIHLSYQNSFILEENIVENPKEYDEITRQNMIATNKFINEKINYFREEYKTKQEQVWEKFFEKVLPLSEYPEEFRLFLEQRSEMLSDVDQQRWKKSDVDKACINAKAGQIIDLEDNIDTQSDEDESNTKDKPYLIKRGNEQAFRDYLTNFRDIYGRLRSVDYKVSARVLEIGESNARRDRPVAQAEFAKLVGLDAISLIKEE